MSGVGSYPPKLTVSPSPPNMDWMAGLKDTVKDPAVEKVFSITATSTDAVAADGT